MKIRKNISFKIRNKDQVSVTTIPIQHYSGEPGQDKKNKKKKQKI